MRKQINELATFLDEGLKLALADKKVIRAFSEQKKADGKKLTTDGKRLDGQWMGGRGIAEWKGGKVHFNDLGSKAAQTVERAVRKLTPPSWIAEERLEEASEVEFDALDADKQKQIRKIERVSQSKAHLYFSGIHGVIAYFDMKGFYDPTRFEEGVLKKIMATDIRWLEGGKRGEFVVGM